MNEVGYVGEFRGKHIFITRCLRWEMDHSFDGRSFIIWRRDWCLPGDVFYGDAFQCEIEGLPVEDSASSAKKIHELIVDFVNTSCVEDVMQL